MKKLECTSGLIAAKPWWQRNLLGESMKGWQEDVILERNELVTKVRTLTRERFLHICDICEFAEQLYHMTCYLKVLDRRIESWT